MDRRIPVVVIAGPTASGKTTLAVNLALSFGGEIVSADSMQVYRGMDIGTAKPTYKEMKGIPHHMLDVAEPAESFSVVRYTVMAGECIEKIKSRRKLPVLAGGTGLYIDSLITATDFGNVDYPTCHRQALEKLLAEKGKLYMHQLLSSCDSESAGRIHCNDTKRVMRGLEVFYATGTPISEWQRRSKEIESPYAPVYIGLYYEDRQELYSKIDNRVDEMLSKGLLAEVTRLLDIPNINESTAMQAIGYKELADYLYGKYSLDEAVSLIKQRTRNYAKRQITWFKRNQNMNWIPVDKHNYEYIYNFVKNLLENAGVL